MRGVARGSAAVVAAAVLVVGTSVFGVGPAPGQGSPSTDRPGETALPSLPLPDCMTLGLNSVDEETDCEGTFANVNDPEDPAPNLSVVKITPSIRTLDFRLDADLGRSQDIVLTWPIPAPVQYNDDGVQVEAYVERFWPETIQRGGVYVQERVVGEDWESSSTELSMDRQGECPDTASTCTYRVRWKAYEGGFSTRIAEPALWRIGLPWTLRTRRVEGGGPWGDRGSATTSFTFRTQPPPPLIAVAKTRRLGPAQFEFSAKGSGPGGVRTDVASWRWFKNNGTPTIHDDKEVFTKDFAAEYPGIAIDQSGFIELLVTDRWGRAVFTGTPYSILQQVGTQGPLSITSFEVVRVANGVAELKAIVKNVSGGPISNVGLVGTRVPAGTVGTEPATVQTIAAGAEREFTVTVPLEGVDDFTVRVQALGTGSSGPVRSTPADAEVDGAPEPGSTTLTQSSAPGDDRVEVASDSGFGVGDHVQVGSGADAETRRVTGFGSLILSAPLAKAHASGAPVVEVAPPGGDVTAPTITVGSPTEGQIIVQGAAATLSFTCADAGVGVEACGGGLVSGSPLDTSTPGAKQVTVRAWDLNGNLATRTVRYTVQSLANRRFVAAAFQDFLGRAPTADETLLHAAALDAGSRTRRQLLTTLASSTEWLSALVNGFYTDILGRSGEPAGVSFWVGELRSGRRSVAKVAAHFYGSGEYFTRLGGGTDDTWIEDLYVKLLEREADDPGRDFWVEQVATWGRTRVALSFYQSQESRETRVEALYERLLGRQPEPAGLAFWATRIAAHGDIALAIDLAASNEYFDLAAT